MPAAHRNGVADELIILGHERDAASCGPAAKMSDTFG